MAKQKAASRIGHVQSFNAKTGYGKINLFGGGLQIFHFRDYQGRAPEDRVPEIGTRVRVTYNGDRVDQVRPAVRESTRHIVSFSVSDDTHRWLAERGGERGANAAAAEIVIEEYAWAVWRKEWLGKREK